MTGITSKNEQMRWPNGEGGGDGFVKPIRVRTGLTDGSMTEVVAVTKGALTPDTPLVTGTNQARVGSNINPFAPKMFGNKKE